MHACEREQLAVGRGLQVSDEHVFFLGWAGDQDGARVLQRRGDIVEERGIVIFVTVGVAVALVRMRVARVGSSRQRCKRCRAVARAAAHPMARGIGPATGRHGASDSGLRHCRGGHRGRSVIFLGSMTFR
jgi:hypothetical protein